jgi:hypothetical protein
VLDLQRYKDKASNWKGEPPADELQIRGLSDYFENKLPIEYLDFLRFNNGGEGDLSTQPILFQLWSVDEVIESDKDLQVREFLPNFMFFGSDGANELFGIKLNFNDYRVFMIPMIVMDEEDVIIIAENFSNFVQQLGMESINK